MPPKAIWYAKRNYAFASCFMHFEMSLMERNLAEMHPAYFGLVMATGIVSIASHLLEPSDLTPPYGISW